MPLRALVLGGGNALGAYLAGAYEALHDADEQPDWVAGSSIGAITAALIAGNAPGERIERLQEFWRQATAPDWWPSGSGARWTAALQTRLFGRPALFHPRLPLSGLPERTGLYDVGPLRRRLESLIDFERLNSGKVRMTVLAVDLQTGEEVVFDSTRSRLTADHVLASAALIPDFPPVRIGDRWLADGGLAANVPVDLVLSEEHRRDTVCYLADLFPIDAPVPGDLASMSMRQSDLTFACQTERTLRAFAALSQSRPPRQARLDVVRTSYAAFNEESAMKSWDFSESSLRRRWQTGQADMAAALRHFRSLPIDTGIHIHPTIRAEDRA